MKSVSEGPGQVVNFKRLLRIPSALNPNTTVEPDSVEHLVEGIKIITDKINELSIQDVYSNFNDEEITRAGLSAYECGWDCSQVRTNIDFYTSTGDFSSDVLSRAKRFKNL